MFPQDGWLGDHLKYTENSEADPVYHLWVGVSVIAATLGRNVCIRMGHTTILPNQFIVLVGRSGNRKSSAIRIGEDLLREAGTGGYIFNSECTKRGIAAALKRNGTALLIGTDHTEFLSKEYYDTALVPFLTSLYEGRMTRRGSEPKSVSFNFLADVTFQWLREQAHPAFLSPDFMSRFILAVANRHRYIFKPSPRDGELRENLVAGLREIADWRGEVHLTPQASRFLARWYPLIVSGEHRLIQNSLANGWHSRKVVHILKLCLVLCASRGLRMIHDDILEEAMRIIDSVEEQMMGAYCPETSNGFKQREKILGVLEEATAGFVTRRDLYRRLQHRFENVREFDDQMEPLLDWGLVTMEKVKTGRRPATVYRIEPHVIEWRRRRNA